MQITSSSLGDVGADLSTGTEMLLADRLRLYFWGRLKLKLDSILSISLGTQSK